MNISNTSGAGIGAADLDRRILTINVAAGFGMGEAARRLSRAADRPMSPATVNRYITDGMKVRGGGRVRLKAVRVGGRWVVDQPALERFLAALTAASLPARDGPADPGPRSPSERQAASEAAEEELVKSGC